VRAEKIEKRRLRQALERYVGPELFDRVLSQEQGLLERRERLDAVVMFADLRGFTRMTSQLSPDTIVHILNGFFIEMVRVVHSTSGTVFSLIGDEIMIGFGVPLPQPDAADRALQTAVAMHRRFADLSDNWRQYHNVVLGLGIGLSQGSVVVGNVGSPNHMQYTMVGDTVNMAHRLVEMAARGEIILSQSVLDGLSGPVETLPIECLPPAAIKGKEGLHTFYRVIA
jgi:class 3 adenylate cyclase